MLRYLSALVGLCLTLLFSIAACNTPRGQWPNCRTIPGHPEWDESGWYCEGIVVAHAECGCSNATKRVHLGPFCAVNETGADIRFERTFPNRVGGSTVCTPVAAPAPGTNAWGDKPCSDCVAQHCKSEAWACFNEPAICRCLDACQKGATYENYVMDLNTCGCAAGDSPVYETFRACSVTACHEACWPDPNADCICP